MDDDGAPTLDEVIGRAVKTLREQREMTQDALARACRGKGLQWGRSSIAMLEAGRRSCSPSELLIVSSALDAPLRLIVSGESLPDRPDTVMLTTTTAADLAAISEALVSPTDRLGLRTAFRIGWEIGQEMNAWSIESGDADQKAARQLGISTERLMSVAESLWGRSLTAERERRVNDVPFSTDDHRVLVSTDGQRAPSSTDDRQRALRALRGHTTRELLKELRATLESAEKD